MSNRELAVTVLLFLCSAVGLSIGLSNKTVEAQPRRDPFRTLVQQTDPPIILFEHVATKRCFLATSTGGLISVERTVCEERLPGIPPIGPPISPEK